MADEVIAPEDLQCGLDGKCIGEACGKWVPWLDNPNAKGICGIRQAGISTFNINKIMVVLAKATTPVSNIPIIG